MAVPAQDCGGGHAEDFPSKIEWSVDNEYVLFGVYRSYPYMDLYLASRETLAFEKVDDSVSYFYWSPRELKFVFLSNNFQADPNEIGVNPVVCEVDRDSGRWRVVRRVDVSCLDAYWLADGKQLCTWRSVVDIETGETRSILPPERNRVSPCVMIGPGGSGQLRDWGTLESVEWAPADGSAPEQIALPDRRGHLFNSTLHWFWSPDSQVYVEYVLTKSAVIDVANRRAVLYWNSGPKSKVPPFKPDYWDPQSRRFLALPSGPFFDLADCRKYGFPSVGIVERDRLGEYTPVAYLCNPGVYEDTSRAVHGVSFTPWSADGTRFVVAHLPVDENDVPKGPHDQFEWVEWDGKTFTPFAVPKGHIAGFARGSNEHLFLPQACWILDHRLPEKRK